MNWENYCCYCGKYLPLYSPSRTKEHLLPKSKKGNDSPQNKILCCIKCNMLRGNQSLEQFEFKINAALSSKDLPEGFNLYDLFIMSQNIPYWNDYLKTNLQLLKRGKTI